MQKEIEALPKTNFMGSQRNYENVKQQLTERYGIEIAEEYDPLVNCRTYNDWKKNNYLVNRGARSFKAVVVVEKKDKDGKVIKKYLKLARTVLASFDNGVELTSGQVLGREVHFRFHNSFSPWANLPIFVSLSSEQESDQYGHIQKVSKN